MWLLDYSNALSNAARITMATSLSIY